MSIESDSETLAVAARCRRIRIRKLDTEKKTDRPFILPSLRLKRRSRSRFFPINSRSFRDEDIHENDSSFFESDPFESFGRKKMDNSDIEKTSTPLKRRKKMIKDIPEVSPIGCQKQSAKMTPKKFGNPLLSSTKLEDSKDNDRLTNATRLFKDRLKVELSTPEAKMVTSQLLHRNAFFDTLLEEVDSAAIE